MNVVAVSSLLPHHISLSHVRAFLQRAPIAKLLWNTKGISFQRSLGEIGLRERERDRDFQIFNFKKMNRRRDYVLVDSQDDVEEEKVAEGTPIA